jgi:hypothetical protein
MPIMARWGNPDRPNSSDSGTDLVADDMATFLDAAMVAVGGWRVGAVRKVAESAARPELPGSLPSGLPAFLPLTSGVSPQGVVTALWRT